MRLTDDETRIIRDTVRRRFGSNARVWLTSRAFKSKGTSNNPRFSVNPTAQ